MLERTKPYVEPWPVETGGAQYLHKFHQKRHPCQCGGGFLLSKTYRDLTPDEAEVLADAGVHIEVEWGGFSSYEVFASAELKWQAYDYEFDWCPDLAKHLKYRVEVE